MNVLAAELQSRSEKLNEAVLQKLYENPFWHSRFGTRGRTHSKQDGNFHFQYLCEALHSNDVRVLTRYAQWLQRVLTTRGMCTLHLSENFERLADVIRDEQLSDSTTAIDYLQSAVAALFDAGPVHRWWGSATLRVVTAAQRMLRSQFGALWGTRPIDRHHGLAHHLCFAVDAVALGRPEIFAAYRSWVMPFLASNGVPEAESDATFAALESAVREDAGNDSLRAEVALSVADLLGGRGVSAGSSARA